jgi:microcystin-dependent protein
MFAGNFAPAGWMLCEGQLLPISENETLFNLIGTTYGGDGQSTFALPDLRGRVPLHFGNGMNFAETGGVETVTLTTQQMPAHPHPMLGTVSQAAQNAPAQEVLAQSPTQNAFPYGTDVPPATLNPGSISPAGGSQPHDNFQPYLCLNFIISLFGIFPSQN